MKRRVLLVAPMVVCLMIAVFAIASSAKENSGMAFNSPAVQVPVSQSSHPSVCKDRWPHGPTVADTLKKLGMTCSSAEKYGTEMGF
jgi:hypothetical protein